VRIYYFEFLFMHMCLTWPWVTVQETESRCRKRLYKPVVLPINGKHKKETRWHEVP